MFMIIHKTIAMMIEKYIRVDDPKLLTSGPLILLIITKKIKHTET